MYSIHHRGTIWRKGNGGGKAQQSARRKKGQGKCAALEIETEKTKKKMLR